RPDDRSRQHAGPPRRRAPRGLLPGVRERLASGGTTITLVGAAVTLLGDHVSVGHSATSGVLRVTHREAQYSPRRPNARAPARRGRRLSVSAGVVWLQSETLVSARIAVDRLAAPEVVEVRVRDEVPGN